MSKENHELEEQCEDAVFQICCTREKYSVKCGNQLEKHLALITKNMTASVGTPAIPNFEKPVITEEQQELFNNIEVSPENKVQHSNNDIKTTLNRLKELKRILNQVERSNNSEIHKLLGH